MIAARTFSPSGLDAWYAPSLRGDMRTGLGTWSTKDIAEFLEHGHNRIGSAFGSMTMLSQLHVLLFGQRYRRHRGLFEIVAGDIRAAGCSV